VGTYGAEDFLEVLVPVDELVDPGFFGLGEGHESLAATTIVFVQIQLIPHLAQMAVGVCV
jgi:hypothetical protein